MQIHPGPLAASIHAHAAGEQLLGQQAQFEEADHPALVPRFALTGDQVHHGALQATTIQVLDEMHDLHASPNPLVQTR